MRVGIVGATGVVGREIASILEERDFPVEDLQPVASARSAGAAFPFRGIDRVVVDLADFDPATVDLAFFSAGSDLSRREVPRFLEAGCRVIDNSSAFRMDPGVPLVVPEINPNALSGDPRLIANPNCSTILFLMAVEPMHRRARIRRAVVSTYQAVSGKGQGGLEELDLQLRAHAAGRPLEASVFAHPIALNCIPHVDDFDAAGDTVEELKMSRETTRIVPDDPFPVVTTCVRVPVPRAHSEAIFLEFERPISPAEARDALAESPGVEVIDQPDRSRYPLATLASGGDEVLVGRIRRDPTVEHGLALWAVGDQIRKGAALNAVQIAERF